jgi:glutathione peroxidase-family protein
MKIKGWAEVGECTKNPNYMRVNCKKSCDRADKQKGAQDLNADIAHIPSFYSLHANDIDGKLFQFAQLKNKVVIIVNVASYCGYTESHYKGLVELYDTFKGTNKFEILAFPSNEFGKQEPETCSVIKRFAKKKGVDFKMMYKINVNGDNADIVYKYLKAKAGPPYINWNFATYFVISPQGMIRSYSGVEPMDLKELTEGLLMEEEL